MDGAPVGQSLDDYASQVAGINQKIDGIVKGGVLPQNDVSYERLKAQRDGIAAKAKALADQTTKAGASAPDFGAAVKKASAALKTPKAEAAPDDAHPLSETVAAIREKYPQYKEVPDDKLIDGIYGKFYKDKMSREEFDQKLADQKPEPSSVLRSLQIGTEAVGRGLANIAGAPFEAANQVLNLPGRAVNTVSGALTGNDKLVPLLPENASGAIKQAASAAEKAAGVPERKLTPGEETASTAEELATTLGGPGMKAAPAAGRLLVKGGEKVGELARTLKGSAAKEAMQDVRSSALKGADTAESTETAAASASEKQAAELKVRQASEVAALKQKQAEEVAALKAKKAEVASAQPGTAAARADIASATKPGTPDATLGRKGALTRLQEETAGTEKELGAAKSTTETASKGVEEATTAEGAAKEAATKLDQDLQAKPGISKEAFGEQLEKTVRDTNDRLKKARAKEADYAGTLDRAGDTPDIDTTHIEKHIDDVIEKTIRNDRTRAQLTKIKRELTNFVEKDEKPPPKSDLKSVMKGTTTVSDEEAVNKLTLRQADSLRKNIDEAIRNKVYDGDAVSKEALAVLKDVRKQLTEAAIGEHEEYAKALGKFSTASRPLEFIEKNPLLRKVVADNPDATEAAVTRSQIVGKLLTEANRSDRKALARLAVESPELRKSARLYFTQDLFGPEGLKSAQSVEQMRKWLAKNKPALDQLGLTKEFKDIKTARETANKAIADATGTLKQSKKTLEAAEQTEADIQRQLKSRQKLVGRAQERVAESEGARSKVLEAKKADVAKRAGAAQERLGKQADETDKRLGKQVDETDKRLGKLSEAAGKVAKNKKEAATEYTRIATNLSRKNADVPAEAQKAVEALRKGGHITEKQYAQMRDRIDEAVQKTKDTKKLRLTVAKVVGAGILLNQVGYPVYRAFMTAIGH